MEVGVYEIDVGRPMMDKPDLVPGHRALAETAVYDYIS
jgi:hypothetical protein